MGRKRKTNKPCPTDIDKLQRDKPGTGKSALVRAKHPFSCKPFVIAMLLVFGLALATRFIYVHQLSDSPLLTVHMGDAKVFDEWAKQIAEGDWLGHETFYQAPLYPYFLATCFTAFGYDYDIVRIVQIIIGSLSCVLLVVIGRQFASLKVGLVAGIILALYPTAIFFDALVQKSVLSLFLMCVYLVLMGKNLHRLRLGVLVLAGSALGLACLTRENLLVVLVVTVVWLCVYYRVLPWRRRLLASCCFVFGMVIVLAPVGIRNWYVGRSILLTTSNVGPNFYIGNGAGATGVYKPLRPYRGSAEYERQDAREIAEAKTDKSLTDTEVNRYWLKRTWQDIASSPGQWVGLLVRKWRMFWSPTEIADTESLEAYADSSGLLDTLHDGLRFDVLLLFAAAGVWTTRRDWRQHALLYGNVLAMAVSITLFFVFSRFRHTALPIMAIFSAMGIVSLGACVRARNYRTCLAAISIGLFTFFVARINVIPKSYVPAAYTFSHLGQILTQKGELDEASVYYEKALALSPNLSEANFGVAIIEGARGNFAAAEKMLKKVVTSNPDYADAHYRLGLACEKTGDMQQALTAYQKAVRLNPNQANAQNNLATVLLHFDQTEAAIDHLQQAVMLSPDNANARYNLSVLYYQQGKMDKALREIEAFLVLSPNDGGAIELYEDIRAALDG